MTLPSERFNAIRNTKKFLVALTDSKQTPRIPRAIRQEAHRCLHHYPWDMHIDEWEENEPDI